MSCCEGSLWSVVAFGGSCCWLPSTFARWGILAALYGQFLTTCPRLWQPKSTTKTSMITLLNINSGYPFLRLSEQTVVQSCESHQFSNVNDNFNSFQLHLFLIFSSYGLTVNTLTHSHHVLLAELQTELRLRTCVPRCKEGRWKDLSKLESSMDNDAVASERACRGQPEGKIGETLLGFRRRCQHGGKKIREREEAVEQRDEGFERWCRPCGCCLAGFRF